MTEYIAVHHSPGHEWDDQAAFNEQEGIQDHFAYWHELWEQGDVLLGGPYPDGTGGLIILTVDEDQAIEMAEADPAVASHLLDFDVRTWRAVLEGEPD